MQDPTQTNEKRIELLRKAGEKHQELYKNAMAGKGVDRHLFALYVCSKGMNYDSEFLKEALGAPWRLSTSQQPQQQTTLRRTMTPAQRKAFVGPGGGFGPVADDGYGVSYMVVGSDQVFFHI